MVGNSRGKPQEPRLVRAFLVGAFTSALTAAGIALPLRALSTDETLPVHEPAPPSPESSPNNPLSGEPRITAEIQIPDTTIGGLAVGAGSIWVGAAADSGRGPSSVIRLDLASNEIVAEIPVQTTPWREQLAATEDAVWVGSSGGLDRIDPATNAVVARVETPGRSVSAIAADATAVWALAILDRSDAGLQNIGSLFRIDPAANEVVAEIPLGSQVTGYDDEVRVGAESVWVLGARLEGMDAEYGGDLIRVDPATNAIAARIPVGGFHMVVASDEVWVTFPADGVNDEYDEKWLWTRVDSQTNEPSEPFELNARGLEIVTPEALWAVDYDEEENVWVTRFDPESLEAEARSEPIRSLFHDALLDPESATVWVSSIKSIVRVDIA